MGVGADDTRPMVHNAIDWLMWRWITAHYTTSPRSSLALQKTATAGLVAPQNRRVPTYPGGVIGPITITTLHEAVTRLS
jgi:hypothetical protein